MIAHKQKPTINKSNLNFGVKGNVFKLLNIRIVYSHYLQYNNSKIYNHCSRSNNNYIRLRCTMIISGIVNSKKYNCHKIKRYI